MSSIPENLPKKSSLIDCEPHGESHGDGESVSPSESVSPLISLFVVTATAGQLKDIANHFAFDGDCQVLSIADDCVSLVTACASQQGHVCLLADVRSEQRRVLEFLQDLDLKVPVIALADNTTVFEDGYPFNCPISDIALVDELMAPAPALLKHRVSNAVKLYHKPLGLSGTGNPLTRAFQQIVNNSSDWIIVKDLQHRFVVVPEVFCEVTGLPMEKIIGKNDLEIGTSKEDVYGDVNTGKPGFWNMDDAVTSSGTFSVEDSPKWTTFESDVRHKTTYRVPLLNDKGDVYALLVCVKDITEQKQNEFLLDERTRMLANVTAEKQSSEEHKHLAEKAVTAKNRFLAAASHDLRQPLHAMGLYLDVLEARLKDEEGIKIMHKLKESNSELYAMFSSLLDISLLDAGEVLPKLEHISISACCRVLENEFLQLATEKNLQFICEIGEGYLYTDKTLCSRIVRNLVKNAIENTEHGMVTLRVTAGSEYVLLEVEDTGCGMQKAFLENIFTEYFPLRPETTAGRIGLGLTIVARMSKLLGILIEVDSTPGEGSLFKLRIPAGDENMAQPLSPQVDAGNIDQFQVLVLDDEKMILEGTQSLLALHGCTAEIATSTDDAFDLLANKLRLPDVIIADYEMGNEETGLTAIERIRRETGSQIPAVLVTGDTSSQRMHEAQNLDVMLLHKPLQPEELVRVICEVQELY